MSTPPTVAAASSGVSVATMPTTMTDETGDTSNNLGKLNAVWLTATGKVKDDSNKKCLQRYTSVATKMATKMYYEEQKKGKEGKSAEEISIEVKKAHDGVGPSARSIRRYVN